MRAFLLYYYSGFKYQLDALLIVLILHYFRFRFEGTKDIVWGHKGWRKWTANKIQWLTVYNPGVKVAYCTHGVDHAVSRKKRQTEEKVNNKVRIICSSKH